MTRVYPPPPPETHKSVYGIAKNLRLKGPKPFTMINSTLKRNVQCFELYEQYFYTIATESVVYPGRLIECLPTFQEKHFKIYLCF